MHTFENSSNLASANYVAETKTLMVAFKSGGSWSYTGVEPDVYDGLINAESPGKYFHANIKGKFEGAKAGADAS